MKTKRARTDPSASCVHHRVTNSCCNYGGEIATSAKQTRKQISGETKQPHPDTHVSRDCLTVARRFDALAAALPRMGQRTKTDLCQLVHETRRVLYAVRIAMVLEYILRAGWQQYKLITIIACNSSFISASNNK